MLAGHGLWFQEPMQSKLFEIEFSLQPVQYGVLDFALMVQAKERLSRYGDQVQFQAQLPRAQFDVFFARLEGPFVVADTNLVFID